MRQYFKYISLIILGCQEPIELGFQSDEEYLVIDGFITDDFGPHTIKISKSEPFTNDEVVIFEKVQNAVVTITDDLGNATSLTMSGPGNYLTPSVFSGQIGRSYTLNVEVNGETYVSTPQQIPAKSSFDSVYFEQGERETFNTDGELLVSPTVKFLCDVDYASQNSYIGITWEGTYEYKTVFRLRPYNCYIDEAYEGFSSIVTNEDVNEGLANELTVGELLFDIRFKVAYSLNTILYSMNEEAHNFHFQINQQRSSRGSVFDPQPFQISGNIRNVNDPDQTILGYFGAYGREESRVFVYPSNINAPAPIDFCTYRDDTPGNKVVKPLYCYDCADFLGAYTEQPPYWIN